MKKKPVIITIVIVAVAAILIGGGIYLYPHLVERTVSEVVKNDMDDIVEIDLINWNNGRRAEDITDKEEIEEIVRSVKNLKVKKSFDQRVFEGGSLLIAMTTSEGEKISLSSWKEINGVRYEFLDDYDKLNSIRLEILEKYNLRRWPEEEMTDDVEE